MKPYVIFSGVLCMFAVGCGGDDGLPPPERVDSEVTIIDNAGIEREIPASSLIDEETGEPAAKQIFVVDRQSSRRKFVDVAEFHDQSPSRMRYVPASKSNP